MDDLVALYDKIKTSAESRNQALETTLGVSEKFWDDLNCLVGTLKDLQDNLVSLEPPALDPNIIRQQQEALEVSGSVQMRLVLGEAASFSSTWLITSAVEAT